MAGGVLALLVVMIWFFVRGQEHLTCEVRQSEGGYELSLDGPDRRRHVQTFDTPSELLARFPAFPRALKLEGWHLPPIWSGAEAVLRA